MRLAVALLALIAVAGGVAAAQDRATFFKDRRGDAAGGPLDIVRVAISRTSNGKLRGELTMAAGWDTADLRPGGTVCLRIHARRAADAEVPDHLVCAVAAADRDSYVARVVRERPNGLPIPSGTVTVSRPTTRTIYLRFAQSAIAKPARIRVSGESVTRGERCRAPLGCRDLAPDAPGVLELTLRSTTDQR